MAGIWNIAHRGASHDRPENTLAAFEEAIRQGADALEVDVRLSLDGECVIIHDDTLERTTNAHGRVDATDYTTIRGLDAGRGERVPTPDEVLELARDRIRVTFDVKVPDAIEPLLQVVQELEMSHQVTYTSFLPEVVTQLRAQGVRGPMMQTITGASELVSITSRFAESHQGISGVGIPASLLHATSIERLQRIGLGIYAWTIDDPELMHELVVTGVNGIVTNRPGLLAAVLREYDVERSADPA